MAPDRTTPTPPNEPLETGQMLAILRRRGWLIVLCAVVVAAAAFVYSRQQPKEYTATASLAFSDSSLSQQVAGLAPSSTVNQITQQASNIELVRLGDMAAKTAKQLGGISEREVSNSVQVKGQGESSVVAVAATSTSAKKAAAIANGYSAAFVAEQRAANRRFFRNALKLVEKQLGKLPKEQRFGQAAVALQNRKQTLQLLDELHYGNVEVAQRAPVPRYASSPSTKKNTMIGAVLGLLIGLGLAFALERAGRNRNVHDADDLAETYGLPLLGQIRESAALATAGRPNGKPPAPLEPDEVEAFNLLRARIRMGDGATVDSLLVAAAARGEGATTVARRLAEASVRLGSRTLLIEADMRDPILSEQLGLHPGTGLPGVLTGNEDAAAAVRQVEASRSDRDIDGQPLSVLAVGISRPANPAALLKGVRMHELLDWAAAGYDVVIVDAPPVTECADAFPLLDEVDGVLIVGAVGRADRELAAELRGTLEASPANLLGVIANRVAGSGPRRGRRRRDAGAGTPAAAPQASAESTPRPAPTVVRAFKS
ncbi:MAG TPA: Wzz/FepE/Etk N-terminal domain-containing protein [Solirubrobacterales bacterium]|jgi:capsular exopolysaccharide synthesis family protein